MRKIIKTILSLLLLVVLGFVFYRAKAPENKLSVKQETAQNTNNQSTSETPAVAQETEKEPTQSQSAVSIPNSALLEVPFTSQAPFGVWDALHEDACEEASLIMVKYFQNGKKTITKDIADQEIKNMIAYENKNGYGISITLKQLNDIAKNYYDMTTGRVEKNITVDDIKTELTAGHPVIVGAAGKVLPNPNFKNGGPNYHMLVIKGYDQNGSITNDPGTRLGEGFRYSFSDLMKSIHDWDPKNILNGRGSIPLI